MSTQHTLLDVPDRVSPAFEGATPRQRDRARLTLDERSGAFDLRISSDILWHYIDCGPDDRGACRTEDFDVVESLSCADLRVIRDRINEVLSYFDEVK